jgi:hypothetical protein
MNRDETTAIVFGLRSYQHCGEKTPDRVIVSYYCNRVFTEFDNHSQTKEETSSQENQTTNLKQAGYQLSFNVW